MKKYLAFSVILFFSSVVAASEQWTPPELVRIPAGPFVMGSTMEEREAAYRLDELAYGHTRTRQWKWYDDEKPKKPNLPAYQITRTPITNSQYLSFVRSSGLPFPDVRKAEWTSYGLIHPYQRTRRFAWVAGSYPKTRSQHPVVLISQADAEIYAKWVSHKTGQTWRLPTEEEWEKAARGADGRWFPWGQKYDPLRLNSHDKGPFDTLPVGSFPGGNSPYGLVDAAGQVFEWTATRARSDRYIVKGGSWDDKGCGICRPAARHSRPARLKHILIGFRLVKVNPQ
jgi:toxoflavin biosynthesis protein ToxD